jgi:phospholipid/cholesterol/gamma-HCH transport system substrate-binding protein
MSTPFRERNPVIIGAISMAVIAAFMLVAFKAGDLPIIGGGDTYYASFTEAGGLKPNDEVRIAGVRVGKVKSVDLAGDHVRVQFQVDGSAQFGSQSGAQIRVKTILGAMYLALVPDGSGQMKEGTTIPVDRTRSPFDIVEVFQGLASRSKAIDTQRLAKALDTMATLTRNTPVDFRNALKGVSALSANVAARDEQLNTLLQNLQKVSRVLGDRRGDIVTLMRDGDKLFRALVARRVAVHHILVATAQLSTQLSGLVHDTRADLKPALDNLEKVVNLLNSNQENLDQSLRLMAPFYRVFANTLGNGPWFDTIIKNMPPVPGSNGPGLGGP